MSNIERKSVTGSVQQKNGAWHAVLYYTDFETGKRKPKWQKIGKITLKRGDGGLTKIQANALLPRYIVEEDNRQRDLFAKYASYESANSEERERNRRLNTDFYEYVLRYVERRSANKSLEYNTYRSYRGMCEARIKSFFHKEYLLKDINEFVLEAFFDKFNDDGLTRSTKTRYKALIKLVLDEAVKTKLIPSNPISCFSKGTFGQSKVKVSTFSDEEVGKLLEKMMGSDDPIAKLSAITFYYALRREEVLGWKWSQIDMEKKNISLQTAIIDISETESPQKIMKSFEDITRIISTKGRRHIAEKSTLKTDGSATEMPLLDSVVELLKEIKAETERNKELFGNCYDKRFEDFVFVRPDGYIITPTYVSSHFSQFLKKIGMKHIRFHDIRHTTATLLLKEGWSIKHIQEWLRHSDPATTAKFYVHPDDKEKQKVGHSLDERFKLPKKEAEV